MPKHEDLPKSRRKAQESAKAALIGRLVLSPVLAHFDQNIDGVVQTDASLVGLGAVLMQDAGDGPRPVAFISRKITDAGSKYHTNELECLAILWALKNYVRISMVDDFLSVQIAQRFVGSGLKKRLLASSPAHDAHDGRNTHDGRKSQRMEDPARFCIRRASANIWTR